MPNFKEFRTALSLPVIVVALGYFVDIFDLTLFNMIRVQSLKSLGVADADLVNTSITLLNSQMFGMLLGGFVWGILGDRWGRLQTLFGSIILYSLANLANAFVHDIPAYIVLRFIAGLGLAGELGVGITLVSELLPTKLRGYGTTFVASIGVCGATLGGFVVEAFDWRICYIIGGVMGLMLLFLRVKTRESNLFNETKSQHKDLEWGRLKYLFTSGNRFMRFVYCVLVGVPIWYFAGPVMAFSPELGKDLGVVDAILSSRSIAIMYLGLAIGDLLSGLFSQMVQSRKKSMALFMVFSVIFLVFMFTQASGKSGTWFYTMCFLIGVGAGFWAIFVTVAAEQFGTNLRATVATTVPNLVRGSVIPMTLGFKALMETNSVSTSIAIVGVVVFTLSFTALYFLPETFHKDLAYTEKN